MIVRRRLSLGSAVLGERILRREDLAGVKLAHEVLGEAHLEAERLQNQAHAYVQGALDQALAEFWKMTDGLLRAFEQQRLSLELEAVESAEELLKLAIGQLLDEAPVTERIRALARSLASAQTDETLATLSCNPELLDTLAVWLSESRFVDHWKLKGDPSMSEESLRLNYANGALHIDWESLRRGLLIP